MFDNLQKIRVESCPFSNLPAPGRNRWDQCLTAAEMKRCRWGQASDRFSGQIHGVDLGLIAYGNRYISGFGKTRTLARLFWLFIR
jgi:hypothetical protein